MAKYTSIFILIGYFFVNQVCAQDFRFGYLVEFSDKKSTPYSIDSPQEFLSDRAIQRRTHFNIPISEQDFPVNTNYTDSLIAYNAKLHVTSKWFNSAVYLTNDSAFVDSAQKCSFVKSVSLVYEKNNFKRATQHNKWNTSFDSLYYGSSFNQIAMCNGQYLHKRGFQGNGMQIALLDGGFYKVDQFSAFDSLFANNQILGTYDFVDGNQSVYEDDSHGMSVLSTIGGNVGSQLVGTAPKASYYLYRTENVHSEYPIEEENWIAGAEAADSAGADIISSSLGYSVFSNADMNHTYQQMDGKSTRATKGAEVAFTKGLFIVVSAGNEGANGWHYITAPSDGEHVLCIGAVNEQENIAYFSSRGPSADGRIKPDVCAKGYATTVLNSNNTVGFGNGTSFSCPVMAGLVACLWQGLPEYSNSELLSLIRSYGKQYNNPDNTFGYGVPDLSKALFLIDSLSYVKTNIEKLIKVYPNPANNQLNFELMVQTAQNVNIMLCNANGSVVYSCEQALEALSYNKLMITNLQWYQSGLYILRVVAKHETFTQKVIIN